MLKLFRALWFVFWMVIDLQHSDATVRRAQGHAGRETVVIGGR
jgi:hypothetical protein